MAPLLILTHGCAVFTGIIAGMLLARWALKPDTTSRRF